MNIDEEMAAIIIAALSVCHSEGITGLESSTKDYSKAEYRLIRELYKLYPELISQYDWLPKVQKIKNEK
jgi:hypothetical protein